MDSRRAKDFSRRKPFHLPQAPSPGALSNLLVLARLDSDLEAPGDPLTNATFAFATEYELDDDTVLEGTVSGEPAAGQFEATGTLSSVDEAYRARKLRFTSGELEGQSRIITTYTGATKTFHFDGADGAIDRPFSDPPAEDDTFVLEAVGLSLNARQTRVVNRDPDLAGVEGELVWCLKDKISRELFAVYKRCDHQNEIQRLTPVGTWTAGTLTLRLIAEISDPLDWDMSAVELRDALVNSIDLLVEGDIVCTGGPWPTDFIDVEFRQQYAQRQMPLIALHESMLEGSELQELFITRAQVGCCKCAGEEPA